MGVKATRRLAELSDGVVVRPLLLTIPQVMECMNLKRNKIYDLINNEGLPVQRFGRAVRVPYRELERWLERRGQANLLG